MRYRRLGRTNLQVSEIGFGCWGIGGTSWIGAVDETSLDALKAARDAGINFFDTALVYGQGRSERLLAQLFGNSPEVIVATKVPPKNMQWPARPGVLLRDAYPAEHVMHCLRVSVANLKREAIDLYQFHVWSDEWAEDDGWFETIEQIRQSGLVRNIGISINDHEPENVLRALKTGLIDSVQVIYNIFDQSPGQTLFPFCQANDIGVIARVPFDEGSLAGAVRPETVFPERDFRNRYFAGDRKTKVWQRVQDMLFDLKLNIEELPQIALRFCISHPAVASVIPGMRTPRHVATNSAASDSGALSHDTVELLRRHQWQRNFYSSSPDFSNRLTGAAMHIGRKFLGSSKLF